MEEGNEFYPLPPDYERLSSGEQREARVNAISLQERPDDLVMAWNFFRTYYLRQTRPGFFYKRFKESPDFHFQCVRDIGEYQFNAIAAPRASAKSTVLAIEIPLLLSLTRPNFNLLLVFSKDTMVTRRMSTQIAPQLMENPYIIADFGSDIRPKKGKGTWNAHLLKLTNGAAIAACSARGGMLGERPDLILIDDPEIDPVMNKVTPDLKENYERFLVHTIMPMLDEGVSALYWIGTLLTKQCFLYHVIKTKTDPRFEFWNRRLLDCEDDGHGNLLWEKKWNRKTLELDKEKLGIAAYNAQRRNRPGTGDEQVLKLHPELSSYYVEGIIDQGSPLSSQAVLHSWTRRYATSDNEIVTEEIRRPFGETVSKMFRILTMDYARCLSPTSDYISMVVIGTENSSVYKNVWWILDLIVGRWTGNDWIERFWDLALKWRVSYAGIESVAAQQTLVNTARDYAERASMKEGWTPRVVPIRYPAGLSKEDRIGSLEWRFAQYRMKLPVQRKHKWPWSQLYHEIAGFTGMPGGTQFDDSIDAVAMVQFLLKGSVRRTLDEGDGIPPGKVDLKAELEKGNLTLPGDIQPGLGVDPSDLSPELLLKLRIAHEDRHSILRERGNRGSRERRNGVCINIRG